MPRKIPLLLLALLPALSAACSGVGLSARARHRHSHAHVSAPAPKSPAEMTVASIESDQATFAEETKSINSSPECFPVPIRDQGRAKILYLYCSDEALDRDGQAVQVTETFDVPTSIARRYNFWRRVYSLWSKDQYVMHLSEYPEVVVEAYDISQGAADLGPIARENAVKKVAKAQRDQYRKLFLAMHRFRDHEELFTPAMKRLARLMAHIPDKDKYLTAYHTLRLQRGQRDFIANGLAVAPKYLPAIEEEFKSQGVPVEITRLAFVESSFNLKACSKVGASGVYQLMPATGKQYLKVFAGIDERNDPIKASRAAAKLLRLNYETVGNWPLAITAYNHGVNGIRRAKASVGSSDLIDLIDRYHSATFGFASKNFYASFLGVLATLKDANRLFPEVPKASPLVFARVRMTKATAIRGIQKTYGVSLAQLAEYNPDLSRSILRPSGILPRGYVLKVPSRQSLTAQN